MGLNADIQASIFRHLDGNVPFEVYSSVPQEGATYPCAVIEIDSVVPLLEDGLDTWIANVGILSLPDSEGPREVFQVQDAVMDRLHKADIQFYDYLDNAVSTEYEMFLILREHSAVVPDGSGDQLYRGVCRYRSLIRRAL